MNIESKSLYGVLLKTVVTILLLFLCYTPVFYLMVSHVTIDNTFASIYMTVRVFRFLLVVFVSFFIRQKNKEIFSSNTLLRKKIMYFILGAICVSVWLHFDNTMPRLYSTISHSIGIYNMETTPLFLSVLWEQLFAGDLYWSLLLCLSIVFFTGPKPVNHCNKATV